MNCPKCNVALLETTLGDIQLLTCAFCHGYWFGPGNLKRVSGQAGHNDHLTEIIEECVPDPKLAHKLCPACAECSLQFGRTRREARQARIAKCTSCGGIWLPSRDALPCLAPERKRSLLERVLEFIFNVLGSAS
jgi:Zn-finger nucleic acid-binding protein